MIDTLHMRLSVEDLNAAKRLEQTMQNVSEHALSLKDSKERIRGKHHNFHISASQTSISARGSLSRYYLGSNFLQLTKETTQMAIERLSDELGFDFREANISRLDIAGNLFMEMPFPYYKNCLGELSGATRGPILGKKGHSLYYSNSFKKLLFYDKGAEMKTKKGTQPLEISNRQILRYELSLHKNPRSYFKLNSLKAKDLYKPSVLMKQTDSWKSEYMKIKKDHGLIIDPNFEIKTKKDLESFLEMAGIQALGGQQGTFQALQTHLSQGNDTTAVQKNRLNNKLEELCTPRPDFLLPNDYVEELNQKISSFNLDTHQ
ncbi:MAG: hypothetical protein QNL04_11105 [SAR324 cluster bacterium]|nr:hypothetical protein [SAR324 cluster bacterium]